MNLIQMMIKHKTETKSFWHKDKIYFEVEMGDLGFSLEICILSGQYYVQCFIIVKKCLNFGLL
jgi:hypothetical protein